MIAVLSVVAWSAPRVTIRVEELVAEDAWRVSYTLPWAVPGIWFGRSRSDFRSDTWTIEQPADAQWTVIDEQTAIVAADPNAGFRTLILRFPSNFDDFTKEYNLNLPFSDGGRLLYTGHLEVGPLGRVDSGLGLMDEGWWNDWRLTTEADRGLVRAGQVRAGSMRWTEPIEWTGTYVYFGDATPVRSDRMTLVVDPGLPAWLVERTNTLVPQLMDHYAEAVGEELSFVPVVYLSWGGAEHEGLNDKGGTLPGLVQLEADGSGWLQPSPHAEEHWFWFLAHETFHFWNGQMNHTRHGSWEEWLSESSANFMALDSLRGFGVVSEDRYRERLVEAANGCILGLGGHPMFGDSPWPYGTEYQCGEVLLAAMDGQLKSRSRGDMRGLLGLVFERGDTYSTFDLLDVYQQQIDDPDAAAPLARLLYAGVPHDAEEFQASLLDSAGVATSRVPVEDAALSLNAHFGFMLDTVFACDCNAAPVSGSYYMHQSVPSGCSTLPEGGIVMWIEDRGLEGAARAHGIVRTQTLAGEHFLVQLHDSDEVYAVPCDASKLDRSYEALLAVAPAEGSAAAKGAEASVE